MKIESLFLFLFLSSVNVFAEVGVKFTDPIGSRTGWGFQGQLLENSSKASMSPELKAFPVAGISKSMSICGYTVHYEGVKFLPFVVLLVDGRLGYADVRLKSNIARENLNDIYTFQIEAYDCDPMPHFSERKVVLIEIKSDDRPTFTSTSFHFSIKRNSQVGTKVGTVTAFERPSKVTPGSGGQGICRYEILSTPSVPFSINEYGVLITKSIFLDKIKPIKYLFKVEASDCSKPDRKKNSVIVMVDVLGDCVTHWTGIPSDVNYDEDNGVQPLVVDKLIPPSLHLCSSTCQNLLAIVSVKLEGKNLRAASASLCKHDDQSLRRQEELCETSKNSVDMLEKAPKSLRDTQIGGYFFPGDVAVHVDPKFNKFGQALSKKFTIRFWMKHAGDMKTKGPKEQILCNSDIHERNRHHFSLFLHNCKLILLIRKEFDDTAEDRYEHSEWRFGPLKEVCDDKWHHYAVVLNNLYVSVQIDGEMVKEAPQYLDDKPLLEYSKGQSGTKFMVGVCYHAKTASLVQYFKGHLASLKVIDNELEAINNIRCVATCGEALLLPHIVDVVDNQSSVTLFSDSVVIRSHDIYNLLKMFSELSYINTEISEELHGRQTVNRKVTIDTDISCANNKVSKADQQVITVHLRNVKTKKVEELSTIHITAGFDVHGYPEEKITLFPNSVFISEDGAPEQLQSCMIRAVGKHIQPWETLEWPISFVIGLHLTGLNNSKGLSLQGRQNIKVYESVLRKVFYVTKKFDSNKVERQFALSCSVKDNMVTNEVIVTVRMKKNHQKTYYVVDDPDQIQESVAKVVHHKGQSGRVGFEEKSDAVPKWDKKGAASNPLMWVILFGTLLVVVVAVFGSVVLYRKVRRQRRFGLKKVFMGDLDGRRQRSELQIISNPSYGQGVGSLELADGDSLTNDIPDSEEDEDDDAEFCYEEQARGRADTITVSSLLGLPSVDV